MWEYIGWKRNYADEWYYWSNAGYGGLDVAVVHKNNLPANYKFTNMPPGSAEIQYGALKEYNGDIIALMDDWGIDRESLNL